MKPNDFAKRKAFTGQTIDLMTEDKLLIMSDKADFHLDGFVNKQNFRYWSDTNPEELYEHPLRSPKVKKWCAVTTSYVIGPYFFGEGVQTYSEFTAKPVND